LDGSASAILGNRRTVCCTASLVSWLVVWLGRVIAQPPGPVIHGLQAHVDRPATLSQQHIGPIRMRGTGAEIVKRAGTIRRANEEAACDPEKPLACNPHRGEMTRFIAGFLSRLFWLRRTAPRADLSSDVCRPSTRCLHGAFDAGYAAALMPGSASTLRRSV
jgi:hypothetical protein